MQKKIRTDTRKGREKKERERIRMEKVIQKEKEKEEKEKKREQRRLWIGIEKSFKSERTARIKARKEGRLICKLRTRKSSSIPCVIRRRERGNGLHPSSDVLHTLSVSS